MKLVTTNICSMKLVTTNMCSMKLVTTNICSMKLVTTYVQLAPYSRVLPKKLTGHQLVKKFPAFYGT